jgi:hypothetical protein
MDNWKNFNNSFSLFSPKRLCKLQSSLALRLFLIRVFENSRGSQNNKNKRFPKLSTIFQKVPEDLFRCGVAGHVTHCPSQRFSKDKQLPPAKVNQSQNHIKNKQTVN